MATDNEQEEQGLRSAALQNANAILVARQRAERALRAATDQLREQSEWFSVILASIGDAVIAVDKEGRISFLNPVAENLTGLLSAEAVGKPLGDVMCIVHERTRQPAENRIYRALAEGIVLGLAHHTTLVRPDGTEIPIEDSAAPIRNPAGAIIGAVMIFRDVSERRQKEIALADSYEVAQAAQAVAEEANRAKDQFIAALSHELRTPLTPVLAILSSLNEDASLPEALAGDIQTVRRNVELEARLIDDLLDLTRITSGKLHLHSEHVSIGRVIEDAITTCVADLEAKRLTLTREFAEPHPTVEVDSARVTQVLWNLLKNSVKFTPSNGTITIRSRIEGNGSDPQLVIEVQDNGIGMEPGDSERIFQPFEQGDRNTSRQFGGLGLGLAISKAIAQAHRGSLSARSAGRGLGSTFTLTLPCAECADPNAPTSEPPAPMPSFKAPAAGTVIERPLRILLVEDHTDTAAILARLLRRMGHDVMTAGSIRSAVEIADAEMPGAGIDLVMSDLGLPDGSGLDLMRTLSVKYELKAIALSGYGMESDVAESTAAGFARHLVKPIDLAILRNTITELMHS